GCVHNRNVRLLAGIERNVRVLEQLLRVRPMLREDCDPDARIELHLKVVVADERLLERQFAAVGDAQRPRPIPRALENKSELITPEPRNRVARTSNVSQTRGEMLEHRVAGLVSERVVDLLKRSRSSSISAKPVLCRCAVWKACSRRSWKR